MTQIKKNGVKYWNRNFEMEEIKIAKKYLKMC